MSRAASVRASVLAARRRWLAARWVENVLAGAAAAGLTIAAGAISAAPARSGGLAAAAGLCGALAALTLAAERRRSPQAFARRLDERLGQAGALTTAFECEAHPGAGALARLHVVRTAARLDPARLRAAVSPPSPVFLAALALGAAVAVLAIDSGPASGDRPAPSSLAGLALSRLADLAEAGEAVPAAELERALEEATWVRDLQAAAARERERAEGALEVLLEAPRLGVGAQAAARELLERLRSPGTGALSGPAGSARPAEGSRVPAGSDQPAVAGAPSGRTMSGPPEALPVPATRPTPPLGPSAPAPAPPTGRWWPRRHDAVVRTYVERTRAALGGSPAGRR